MTNKSERPIRGDFVRLPNGTLAQVRNPCKNIANGYVCSVKTPATGSHHKPRDTQIIILK